MRSKTKLWATRKMALSFDFTPRLMPGPQAAHYLGISETKLRSLSITRRVLDGKRLYHLNDLIAYADSLDAEGEAPEACDDIFKMRSV